MDTLNDELHDDVQIVDPYSFGYEDDDDSYNYDNYDGEFYYYPEYSVCDSISALCMWICLLMY